MYWITICWRIIIVISYLYTHFFCKHILAFWRDCSAWEYLNHYSKFSDTTWYFQEGTVTILLHVSLQLGRPPRKPPQLVAPVAKTGNTVYHPGIESLKRTQGHVRKGVQVKSVLFSHWILFCLSDSYFLSHIWSFGSQLIWFWHIAPSKSPHGKWAAKWLNILGIVGVRKNPQGSGKHTHRYPPECCFTRCCVCHSHRFPPFLAITGLWVLLQELLLIFGILQ